MVSGGLRRRVLINILQRLLAASLQPWVKFYATQDDFFYHGFIDIKISSREKN
jgi:hypothetical protein